MKLNGNLINIRFGGTSVHQEKQATLTLDIEHAVGAGSSRSVKLHTNPREWKMEGELLFSYNDFSYLFGSLVGSTMPVMTFAFNLGGEMVELEGSVILTALRISTVNRQVVTLSYSAIGSGKPSFYSETGERLVITADPFYILTSDNYFVKAI